jgi:Zn-dependent protease
LEVTDNRTFKALRIFGNVTGQMSEAAHRTNVRLSKGVCMYRFMVPFRLHSAGWLLLAFCILIGFAFFRGWLGLAVGALLVASLLLHEVGHMLAAIMLGIPVREFGLCLSGAYNRRACSGRRRDEILISAAGPLVNLCLVLPLLFLPVIGAKLALCNLLLCVVNLLPLPSSDGLRILRAMRGPSRDGGMIPVLNQPRSTLPVRLP